MLLQIVSELDIEWYASEDAQPKKGWIVRSHVDWRGELNILYKVWKPLPSIRVLKR